MKKLFFAIAVLFTTTLMAQNSSTPVAVKNAFTKAHPNATKVKYEKENGQFEVSFVEKGNEMSVIYNGEGALQESEHEIKTSELPVSVLAYMKAHYKGTPVKGAAVITKSNGTINYEAAVKGKDVIFDANGKFLKEMKD